MPNARRRPSKGTRDASKPNGVAHFSFGANKANRDTPSLAEVKSLGETLDLICQAGDAILLSSTSDGGAVVVTILSGDAREKTYAGGQAELDAAFLVLFEFYNANA